MSVYNPDGLQIGVDNRTTNKLHTPLLHILRDGVGERRGSLDVAWFVDDLAIGKAPDILIERAELLLNFYEYPCINYART